MQAQEAEQRAEAVEAAVQQTLPQSAVKLYVTSALTAVLSFAVVSGMHQSKCRIGKKGGRVLIFQLHVCLIEVALTFCVSCTMHCNHPVVLVCGSYICLLLLLFVYIVIL